MLNAGQDLTRSSGTGSGARASGEGADAAHAGGAAAASEDDSSKQLPRSSRRGTARASSPTSPPPPDAAGLPTTSSARRRLLLALADFLVDRFRTRLFERALEQRQGLPALLIWLRVYVDSLRGPSSRSTPRRAPRRSPRFGAASSRDQPAAPNVRSMVEHYLRDGIEHGGVRRDVDPAAQAALLIGTLGASRCSP